MAQATLDPIEVAYRRLKRRRFLVWCARLGLPFIAFVAVGGFVAANYAQKKLEQIFGGRVSFNPDGVVIESPRFEGTLSNGLYYTLDSGDVIYGTIPTPTVTFRKIDAKLITQTNAEIIVKTEGAVFLVNENKVSFDGRVDLEGDDGSKGYFIGGNLDLDTQIFTAEGPLHMEQPCGSSIDANNGVFDSSTSSWVFEKARLLIIQNEDDEISTCQTNVSKPIQ